MASRHPTRPLATRHDFQIFVQAISSYTSRILAGMLGGSFKIMQASQQGKQRALSHAARYGSSNVWTAVVTDGLLYEQLCIGEEMPVEYRCAFRLLHHEVHFLDDSWLW